MNKKRLIFVIILLLSVFGITCLNAVDYYGNTPSERLLAQWGPDPDGDDDGDGVSNDDDMCPSAVGDAAHCGCPSTWVVVISAGQCQLLVDPDDPNNQNDSEGVPVGGGILLLLGSALAYGATKRRNKSVNEETIK